MPYTVQLSVRKVRVGTLIILNLVFNLQDGKVAVSKIGYQTFLKIWEELRVPWKFFVFSDG